ncbi:nitric-oxide reductase large subunit [Brackiella oedipodis]|uniref:nitric-oxide reductase large subunit n=1 Tax=Brackiella oedipodis TaxID=124225 RepID=UPI00048BDE69|nr:nitric-oxide reductase large subunit [Brackiella oedipodis]
MREYKKLWLSLFVVLALTLTILGFFGADVYRNAPPIPNQFKVQSSGEVLLTKDDILLGQSAWQSSGGMEVGSIWGHGAYQAPDWTADWLHRELENWLALAAQEQYHKPYEDLDEAQQTLLQVALKKEYRQNTYDQNQGVVYISARRAAAIANTAKYYEGLYGDDPALAQTRSDYAMKNNALAEPEHREALSRFFFWTAWAAATDRPGEEVTYTNNWPHEPLIGNVPSAENIMWSLACIIVLLAGIGLLVWGWAFLRRTDPDQVTPSKVDPITKIPLTESQKALGKYCFLTVALFIVQVFLGGAVAHYTIEGQSFYGLPLAEWFPYALLRTWHLQSAILWIATGFLTAGLFLAPIINGGQDPKWQKAGVNFLFIALLIVTVGSFAGQYLAINGHMPRNLNFMWGHQGYEYLDLGRIWQILLFVGIAFWLFLMLRGMRQAFKQKGDKNLLALFVASVVAIGLFYGSGLFYGEHSNLSVMEYWRWWVVHLWVEGFFEVFATAAMAFIFYNMGLLSIRMATVAPLASASLFMAGGIPGTFHHLYFAGTTTPVLAVGASFSAFEVVPLMLLGYEAWENWHMQHKAPWMQRLRWPIMMFVGCSFWNMMGAGVFGFMINTPLMLYYIQGLNTTAVHAHTALFGVYGFLAIGFVLMTLVYIRREFVFSERRMRRGFWLLNIGLAGMVLLSLLPIGIIQFHASASVGLWYARSQAFMQQDILHTLRWLRTIPDVVFIVGALFIFWEVLRGLFVKNRIN